MFGNLSNLYHVQKLSTKEIADLLKVSQWKIISEMRRLKISRRTPGESLSLKFNRSPTSFKLKHDLSDNEKKLLQVGLMLYWAEGAKADHGIVDFVNSNPKMVLIFLKLLRKIYAIKESKLRILYYGYSDQDTTKILKYWSNLLNIPTAQFTKPYIRTDFKVSKSGKMPYGLVHIRYNDKRLHRQIMKDIDIIASEMLRW